MNAEYFKSLLDRDWALVARSKARHWRRLLDEKGPEPALRASETLRDIVRIQHPGWPSKEDRARDFENHVRVADMFERAARDRT